jgi:hypothetical protein
LFGGMLLQYVRRVRHFGGPGDVLIRLHPVQTP